MGKPSEIRPQLAKPPSATSITPTKAMESTRWRVERKYDGMRALFHILPDSTLIFSRTGQDLCPQFPELCLIHEHLESPALLDGEIVAMQDQDTENLELLQMRAGDRNAKRRDEIPVRVIFFDVLAAGDFDGTQHPLSARLEVLHALLARTPYRTPEVLTGGDVPEQWEGVILKKRNSLYQCGKRTSEWLKYKATHRATLWAYGLTPGEGSRSDSFGAVLVRDENGVPRGQVGSGFSAAQIAEIMELDRQGDPYLIEVGFRFLSKTGLMVNTAYRGLRTDKAQADHLDSARPSTKTMSHPQKGRTMPDTAGSPAKSKSKLRPLLEDGSDRELADFLIAHPTYSDRLWESRAGRKSRKTGEDRQSFIRRALMGEE
jgi:bifunctional non-homologous end joining protein LigD